MRATLEPDRRRRERHRRGRHDRRDARRRALAADGYTISFGHLGTHVVNGAIYSLPFDLVNDLEPVAMLGANPMLVVSKNALPAKTLQELIAWVKANQDKATFGTARRRLRRASSAGVYFQSLIGTKANYVPYRGTGPALQDLVAGQIDMIVDQASNSLPQVNAGTIRAYAVTDTKRIRSASSIPTVAEAGLPGFHVSLWSGLWAPKDTPKDVIGKLNEAVRAAFADAGVQKRYAELGLELPAAAQQTPEALRAHQKAEVEKWWPVIKAANIKPQCS